MDQKTLGTTVDHLYQSVQSVAEKNPNILFEKRGFERVLTVAETLFADHGVTKNNDFGDSNTIRSIGLIHKLAL
jgi:hypothetical protein